MKFEIDADFAREIDEEALTLVSTLAVEPKKADDSSGNFRPNYLTTIASLRNRETPNSLIQPVIGVDGFEVARFFPDLDPPVGLFERSHYSFIRIAQKLHEASSLRPWVSETYLVEICFEWMRQRYLGLTDVLMSQYLLTGCERDVVTQDVWLPLVGIQVDQELDMGKVGFKPVPQAIWKRWVSEWNARLPAEIRRIKRFIVEVGTQSLTVAACQVTAEPIKAVEIALENSEKALDVLRYFSPSNRYPSTPAFCAILGREIVDRPRHMIVQDSVLVSAGSTIANLRAHHPWRIDTTLLLKMKEVGFDDLRRLINRSQEDRSELQNDIIKALRIYSRSCLAGNLTDKLLYAVLTLECVLLKDDSESLQKHIGERMAFIIGKSLEARVDIIRNYKAAYALRSGAVHHGRVVTEEEILGEFMPNAWHTLNWIFTAAERFTTKQEMIAFVDDIKFS